jgi:hypothetical protein
MASNKNGSTSAVGSAALAALGSLNTTVDFVRQTWAGFGLPTALAPTVDVAELDKKITDLKAVEQWLEVNQSLLRTSIQSLEVQRNTIAAVQAFGDTLKESHPGAKLPAPATNTVMPGVDTNAWWNLLQGQFNQIAQAALKPSQDSIKDTVKKAARKMATDVATQVVTKAATKAASQVAAGAASVMSKSRKPATSKTRRKRV